MKKRPRKLGTKQITKKLEEMLLGKNAAAQFSPATKIVADWVRWGKVEEWLKKNPSLQNEIAWSDDQGEKQTVIEDHQEKYSEIKGRTWGLIQAALLKSDPSIFRTIAAEISKQNRLASKRKWGEKEINYIDLLLLKDSLTEKPNVTKLAKKLMSDGYVPKGQTLENVIRGLRKRREKLKLPPIAT